MIASSLLPFYFYLRW